MAKFLGLPARAFLGCGTKAPSGPGGPLAIYGYARAAGFLACRLHNCAGGGTASMVRSLPEDLGKLREQRSVDIQRGEFELSRKYRTVINPGLQRCRTVDVSVFDEHIADRPAANGAAGSLSVAYELRRDKRTNHYLHQNHSPSLYHSPVRCGP